MLTTFLIIIGGCLGAMGAFQLQKMGVSPVIASCIVGLVGAMIGFGLKNEDLSMVIFAGSFVGMTTVSIASFPIIIIAGLACGLLYWLSLPLFDGVGGKLGALAFISISIILLLFWLLEKIKGNVEL